MPVTHIAYHAINSAMRETEISRVRCTVRCAGLTKGMQSRQAVSLRRFVCWGWLSGRDCPYPGELLAQVHSMISHLNQQCGCWSLFRGASNAIQLHKPYAMPGADFGYGPTAILPRRCYLLRACFAMSGAMLLRAPYAMSDTDLCYAATSACKQPRLPPSSAN
eukprot:877374-Rhodomonas_salina.1